MAEGKGEQEVSTTGDAKGLCKVKRALLSAWRKDGVAEFGRFLAEQGVEVLSTGGTAKCLRDALVPVRDVSEVTGFPELFDGRVKTLHPRIHGGLLFRRDHAGDRAAKEAHEIPEIDLVLVDLYPFEEACARPDARTHEIVEMIDIGGPAMVRSASKNHADVLVLVDVNDLALAREEIERQGGATSLEFRRRFAAKAFRRTAAYDAAIAAWMTEEKFPERIVVALERREVTRYGENPHQDGAVYAHPRQVSGTLTRAAKLGGKELSYNNYLDASAALELVLGRKEPTAVIIKHKNPCGAAESGNGIVAAFHAAYLGDPLSAFGGILAINRPFSLELAKIVGDPKRFFEVIVAPKFEAGAKDHLVSAVKWGKSVRLLEIGADFDRPTPVPALELRSIHGGVLLQDADRSEDLEWKVVTEAPLAPAQRADLEFAWHVCRFVTSNAIVLAKDQRLLGCGAGQMSRVDSVHLATRKAGDQAKGAVLASDAFFPFPDGILAAADAGISAIIQPGGSVRDAEVIAAATSRGLTMVFTGTRHFRH